MPVAFAISKPPVGTRGSASIRQRSERPSGVEVCDLKCNSFSGESQVPCEAPYQTATGPVGLSPTTYRAASAKPGWALRVHVGGDLAEIEGPPGPKKERAGGGRRGRITAFSKGSRKRMKTRMAKFQNEALALALFVHLTYPEEYPKIGECKQHLRALIKRIRRRWKRAAVIWRMEFQARGAPHFHLIVLGVPFMPWDWLAQAWYEVVGSGDPQHLKAGTRVERVHSYMHAKSYVEKYLAKVEEHVAPEGLIGRCWGVEGAWRAFLAAVVEVVGLTFKEAARLFRTCDGLLQGMFRRSRNALVRKRKVRRRALKYSFEGPDGERWWNWRRRLAWSLPTGALAARLPDLLPQLQPHQWAATD